MKTTTSRKTYDLKPGDIIIINGRRHEIFDTLNYGRPTWTVKYYEEDGDITTAYYHEDTTFECE